MANPQTNLTRHDFLKLGGKTGMVGADQIMVGTDDPFDLGDWMAAEKIQTMECTNAEREAILHGNAGKLLRL